MKVGETTFFLVVWSEDRRRLDRKIAKKAIILGEWLVRDVREECRKKSRRIARLGRITCQKKEL